MKKILQNNVKVVEISLKSSKILLKNGENGFNFMEKKVIKITKKYD